MNIRRFKIFGPSASILVLTGQQPILLNLIFVRFQVKQAVVIVEPYGWIFIHSINRFSNNIIVTQKEKIVHTPICYTMFCSPNSPEYGICPNSGKQNSHALDITKSAVLFFINATLKKNIFYLPMMKHFYFSRVVYFCVSVSLYLFYILSANTVDVVEIQF